MYDDEFIEDVLVYENCFDEICCANCGSEGLRCNMTYLGYIDDYVCQSCLDNDEL